MNVDVEKFERSSQACVQNSRRLLEDACWSGSRESIGLALAMLAQEEAAKGFVLGLVRDGVIPWTDEVRSSLTSHQCKHLVAIAMEWLAAMDERRMAEIRDKASRNKIGEKLPPDVAIAMNIYRHEMIERIGKRTPTRFPDWRGRARKAAQGRRDRKKQNALYVGIRENGDLESVPTSSEGYDEEMARAKALLECADGRVIFARDEYRRFAEVFKAMFDDMLPGQEQLAENDEEVSSPFPGVKFVRRKITVAEVIGPEN